MRILATAPVPAHVRLDTAATAELPTLAAWTADEAAAFKFLTDVQRRLAELAGVVTRTLAALPRCGQLANVRIEVYSPAGGQLHGPVDDTNDTTRICERLSARLADPHTPAELKAHLRTLVANLLGELADAEFLAESEAILNDPHLTPTQKLAAVGEVFPRVLGRGQLAEREWLAYGRGVRDRAGIDLAAPWPTPGQVTR